MINFDKGPEITFPLSAPTRSQTQQSKDFQRLIFKLDALDCSTCESRCGYKSTTMNVKFYQGNKPCKETKKNTGGTGVGKREGDGRKCLWPLRDSRKGVQTHFADLVNNPCRVDARPARNGSEPAAGFLFPLSQVQGSRPSPPPPLGAAGNLRGHAPCRLNLGAASPGGTSSEHPLLTPSSCCRFQLSAEQVTRALAV